MANCSNVAPIEIAKEITRLMFRWEFEQEVLFFCLPPRVPKMKAALNRFAALDPENDSDESSDDDTAEDNLNAKDLPVTYSFETSQWSFQKIKVILHEFKLQNITADKKGIIFLRFVNEAQAKKVLHWLTQDKKIKAKIARVANFLGPKKCYHCHKGDHWASECRESLLSEFPSELITLISADMIAPSLFSFMLCSKTVFNAIANRQKIVIVARPHWEDKGQMKLKLSLLKHFKTVEKLVFRSLKCNMTAIPMEAIAQNYMQLTSLTINNCKFSYPSDTKSDVELETAWVQAIAGMTRLRKLDLDLQKVSPAACNNIIATMTHLTQLRISSECGVRESACNRIPAAGLKKLSLRTSSYMLDRSLVLKGGELDQIRDLQLFLVNLKNIPEALPSLERLIIRPIEEINFDAPNLTKLAWYGGFRDPQIRISSFGKFSKLLSLTLNEVDNAVDLSHLVHLTKLVVRSSGNQPETFNLAPLVNLKFLHLVDPKPQAIGNIPDGIELMRLTLNSHVPGATEISSHLSNLKLTRFEFLLSEVSKLFAMNALPGYLEELSECASLRELKVEFADKAILPYYAKFTQIKVLDLIQSSKTSVSVPANDPTATHDNIVELSQQLPNARISHGVNFPTTLRRPNEGHWYYLKIIESNLRTYICDCTPCVMERKWSFDEEDRSSNCIGPKPSFKSYLF